MTFAHSTPLARSLALAVMATLTLAFPGYAASAQDTPTAASFEGVWKITKVVKTGADAGTDAHPQPGLQIFYRGYFSLVRDNSHGPRQPSPEPKDPAKLTDEERLARYAEWAPFSASAGTYEVKGDTLITHNIVARQARG